MEESQLRLLPPFARQGKWRGALLWIALALAIALAFMGGDGGSRREAAAPAFANGLAAAHALAGEFFVLDIGPFAPAMAVSPTAETGTR